jgi:muramoyltetrapeptide carboxypeptidase
MIIPPYLQPGDTVGIVCTARKFSSEEAIPAIALLESWGLRVRLGKTIGLNAHQLGGTDTERAADLQQMINDPNIKAIWCARGGYGTVRIIDNIQFKPLLENPKWIIGFSDVTVLHSHLNSLNVASMHAIMPFSVPKASEQAKQSLYNALFGKTILYDTSYQPENILGKATGTLVGGNLSILYALLGSPSAIDCTDKILFIEDLDEYLYHIDRMLMNLKRNGYFSKLKGLIIGGMTDMHDNEIPFGMNVEQIILDHTRNFGFPVAFGFLAGHISDNRALILGKEVTLEVNTQYTRLTYKK